MIEAQQFIHAASQRGIDFYAGVPCSYLTPFINQVITSPDIQYVGAANEGDAVAIGAGAELGGRRAVVMFQNSGLGNAVSPLTSLNYVFRIPVLVITTLRGEPGGAPDEPQHELMGEITTRLLDEMQIPWEYFPAEDNGSRAGTRSCARAYGFGATTICTRDAQRNGETLATTSQLSDKANCCSATFGSRRHIQSGATC